MQYNRTVIVFSILIFLTANISAQTGGVFTITQSVIAGGGQQSAGGTFSLDGTVGQTIAGNSVSGAPFAVLSGFWTPTFAPSAAAVSVSGRILTPDGRGLQNARVVLTDQQGVSRFTLSGSFGYFRFEETPSGETYVVSISSKRYQFAPRVISVEDEITELDFTAEP